jgi:hypothetical protein
VGVSQQVRIYLSDLRRQIRGEVDLMRSDILPQESLASMQGDLYERCRSGSPRCRQGRGCGRRLVGDLSGEDEFALEAPLHLERGIGVGHRLRTDQLQRHRDARQILSAVALS